MHGVHAIVIHACMPAKAYMPYPKIVFQQFVT